MDIDIWQNVINVDLNLNIYIKLQKRVWDETWRLHSTSTIFKTFWKDLKYIRIIQRTNNPNYSEYYLYGERGISSEYFKDFIVFYNDLFDSIFLHCEEFGEKDTTIERIDVNGNYDALNCKCKQQEKNKQIIKEILNILKNYAWHRTTNHVIMLNVLRKEI